MEVKRWIALLVLAGMLANVASAYTVVLQPGPADSKDTWISSANESGFNQTKLNVGRYWKDLRQEYWSFLQFNYSGLNITNSSNVSATLELYYYYGSAPNNHYAYAANGSWAPSTLTWSNKPAVGQYYSAESSLGGSWYGFDVTQHVLSVKRSGMTNNGFILKNPNATNYDYYYSSRYLGNTSLIPKLVVTIN